MYDTETKNQFIELRAQGLSLDAISAQLDVPRATLGRWHHESIEQIQRLRALQWHLLEEQIGHRLEDSLQRVAQRIRKWEDELDRRDPSYRKTPELVRCIRDTRREYLQLRSLLLAPLQPTRTRIACLTSLDPQKRDKTRQNQNSPTTTPLPTNDLQKLEPARSHSAINSPLQRGEPAQPSVPTVSAVSPTHNGAPEPSETAQPTPRPANAQDQTQIANPKSEISLSPLPLLPSSEIPGSENADPFLGSIVVNPYECATAIVLKTLEQESTCRARDLDQSQIANPKSKMETGGPNPALLPAEWPETKNRADFAAAG